MPDHQADVAEAILEARERLFATIRDAHTAGFPVGRLVGLVGFSTVQHLLGNDAVEPWRINRGYAPRKKPTPAELASSRNND